MLTLPEVEATVFRRVAEGTDPWAGGQGCVGSRLCSQALGRLQRKKLVDHVFNYDDVSEWVLTDAGLALAALPKCQAEDMGGHPACDSPSELQTKAEPRRFYCRRHRKNRHVWRPRAELEPLCDFPIPIPITLPGGKFNLALGDALLRAKGGL